MPSNLDEAIAWKQEHPDESFRDVADRFKVSKTTLCGRFNGTQLDHVSGSRTALTNEDERLLVSRINDYASRGTLLTHRHVKEMAEKIANKQLGTNWTSRFVKRHQAHISSRYFTFQENTRLKADTLENRKAFYNLVLAAFTEHQYRSDCIFNMDEAPFNLGYTRKTRRIAPNDHPRNHQASPPRSEHITCVATIGIGHSPVPPLIIFKGKQVMENWVANHDDKAPQLCAVSDSGWSNTHLQLKWLENAFDLYTKPFARNRDRRLLFLDGAEFHVKVEFLDACLARNIDCIFFPAHLTGRFQPLDVDFFNTLKKHYFEQSNDYMRDTGGATVKKADFWGWHQEAWRKTAIQSKIRGAWRKSGLYPLNSAIFEIDPSTSPPEAPPQPFPTPQSVEHIRSNSRAVRQGRFDVNRAFEKTSRSLENVLYQVRELGDRIDTYESMHKALTTPKPRGKKARFPQGELINPSYHQTNETELAIRRREEAEAKEDRKGKAKAKGKGRARKSARPCIPGPSTTVQDLEEFESEEDE